MTLLDSRLYKPRTYSLFAPNFKTAGLSDMDTFSGYPIGNAPSNISGVLDSAQGQILLEALARFIQPVVTAYAQSPGRQDVLEDHQRADAASQAGRGLLLALGEFVHAVVIPPKGQHLVSDTPASHDVQMASSEDPSHSYANSPSFNQSLTRGSREYDGANELAEIPPQLSELLRKRVSNRMPIRMLACDESGSDPKLVERSEVLQICTRTLRSKIIAQGGDVDVRDPHTMTRLIEESTQYAILSHEWMRTTPGDVVYKDWSFRHNNVPGYQKITNFCRVAAHDYGIILDWADTVCINKDSSSELDESIRSMYKWYRYASVCITYLSQTSPTMEMHSDSWFTRGWTLQELLAPTRIEFYCADWTKYRDAHPQSDIAQQIDKATKITPAEQESFRLNLHEQVPLSRRMQMASGRQVTREEDTAYSLMGILGVDISVAYGEGSQRAFFRLLRELVGSKKYVLDIFNCSFLKSPAVHDSEQRIGTLIPSDIEQYRCRSSDFTDKIDQSNYQDKFHPTEPITITHLGVHIPLLLVPALFDPTSTAIVYQPRRTGSFYGIVELPYPETVTQKKRKYQLLHRDIFDNGSRRQPTIVSSYLNESPRIATFGIFNFGIDSTGNILLPRSCISIPLNCGNKVGDVSQSDRTCVIPNSVATVFSFGNTYKLDKAQLLVNGLQLVTLYL